ncbi:uncharacterized protein UBRO_20636 [Ustilago bromivora]|uniref:Retroviral polymerase SH3-like domain-containing protein n=1 Tax=Ustilago bromivora TaxID=307758 RepID=A0A1K0G3Z1_9BASI|nr:uncharacterized protein UBRO_20636 [Ustilago bromivora]
MIAKIAWQASQPKPKWDKVLKEWITYAATQTGHKLKTLWSDNGTEWVTTSAITWQNNAGFCWQKTSTYNSEQNRKVEWTIGTVKNMMMVMMWSRDLPQTFWLFAAKAAAFTKNLIPNVKGCIPYHVFYDKDPRKPFHMLQTFGYLAWVHVPKAKSEELDDAAIPAIFVGYDKEQRGWKFVSPKHSPMVFWLNTARFLKNQLWKECTDTIPTLDISTVYQDDPADIWNTLKKTFTMKNNRNPSMTFTSRRKRQTQHLRKADLPLYQHYHHCQKQMTELDQPRKFTHGYTHLQSLNPSGSTETSYPSQRNYITSKRNSTSEEN